MSLSRRDFLKMTGVLASSTLLPGIKAKARKGLMCNH